jgi:hypothetical protein
MSQEIKNTEENSINNLIADVMNNNYSKKDIESFNIWIDGFLLNEKEEIN